MKNAMNPTEKQILEKLHQAREAYMRQQYHKATALYKWVEAQIQDDRANLPIIQIELGWSYYNAGDFKKAIHYLEEAQKSSTLTAQQRFDCLRLIGFSYQALGKTEQALDFLERALSMDTAESDKKYIYFEIGKMRFLQGALIKSKTYLEKAVGFFDWQEEKYYQSILYYLGFVAFYEKQLDRAKQHFSEIIEKASENEGKATGYFGMAHILYECNNYRELTDTCHRILELDQNFYDRETLAFFLSKSNLELKRYDEFAIFYNQLRKKYPEGRYRDYYPIFEKRLRSHSGS